MYLEYVIMTSRQFRHKNMVPKEWNKSVILPIKTGDKGNYTNYMKITCIIPRKIRKKNPLQYSQCGF